MPMVLPDCPICLEEDRSDNVSVTSCGHVYHTKCIRDWAAQPGGSECPSCCQKMKNHSKSRFIKLYDVELMPQESPSTLCKLEAEKQSFMEKFQQAEKEKLSFKEKFEEAEKEKLSFKEKFEQAAKEKQSFKVKFEQAKKEKLSFNGKLEQAEKEKQSFKEKYELADKEKRALEKRLLGESEAVIESIIKAETSQKVVEKRRKNLTESQSGRAKAQGRPKREATTASPPHRN